ncbi:hypothetical protein H310_08436 [Aphanomyces invadans]|uniref:HIT-type domain-containing protein n=1 Tax=Aphanomyces invadans TaxID=157072 RepID=A0A024U050_9STRA|nr:hypothetical protein H310_08436 [Aphanomyces invadans]ETV98957.1 hypothetical protein H310_08436 [Aphanomyces invadans]|eukprot:XP_008872385.1 hypothetical protein H310_08436 [Aphanomyces invadans]
MNAAASPIAATPASTEMDLAEPEHSPIHTPTTEYSSSKRKRDGEPSPVKCTQCSSFDIKYRCPRCERITCSLACCLAHKKQFDCDGKRDRTKFIALADFQDADMSSDFFFLQEISRSTSAVHLDVAVKPPPPSKRSKGHNHKSPHNTGNLTTLSVNPELPADYLKRFPPSVQSFVQQAKKRGVFVHLHAPGMSRHKANTSTYNSKENCVLWRLEMHFTDVAEIVTIVEPRWSERLSLCDVITKHLSVTLENVPLRTKLKPYCKLDVATEWLFLIKKEFAPASAPQYYKLDPTMPLGDSLKHLAIVEFPTVLVTLASRRHEYTFAHRAIEVVDAVAASTACDTTAPPLVTEVSSTQAQEDVN